MSGPEQKIGGNQREFHNHLLNNNLQLHKLSEYPPIFCSGDECSMFDVECSVFDRTSERVPAQE
jgi:hypothetical protein